MCKLKKKEVKMTELKDGCVKPARGPIVSTLASSERTAMLKEDKMMVRVGQLAIDFEVNAYINGVGFQPIKLSDYKGKWIVLCFYPGDFTFV
jgi:peroxiredoxin (alkyl hydroperoxide reductase subunit C)